MQVQKVFAAAGRTNVRLLLFHCPQSAHITGSPGLAIFNLIYL